MYSFFSYLWLTTKISSNYKDKYWTKYNSYLPSSHLSLYQNAVYPAGITVFISVVQSIISLVHIRLL